MISSMVSRNALNIFLWCCFLAFDEYRNISQKDIEDSIKGELSGHFEDLLLAIGKLFSAYKLSYFALVLNQHEVHSFLVGIQSDSSLGSRSS